MDDVHFWTLREHAAIEEWDPDSDPDRYSSGYSHSFLELYVRLARAGDPVTIGSHIPKGTNCVLVSLEELSEWHRHGLPRTTLALARHLLLKRTGLAVVRNDIHPHIAVPQATTLELMPTHASVTSPSHQSVVPLLPQRGLRRRSVDRPCRVSTVVLKAYPENIPAWVPDLKQELQSQGVMLRIDDRPAEGGRSWGDFSDADAALCTQRAESLGDPTRKPPTKLVNAWAAHVIPLCEPQIAYMEVADADRDAIFASTAADFAAAVARLNTDEDLTRAMFESSERRSHEYSTSRILDLWRAALTGVPRTRRRFVWIDIALALTQLAFGPRYSSAIRRRVRLPHPPRA